MTGISISANAIEWGLNWKRDKREEKKKGIERAHQLSMTGLLVSSSDCKFEFVSESPQWFYLNQKLLNLKLGGVWGIFCQTLKYLQIVSRQCYLRFSTSTNGGWIGIGRALNYHFATRKKAFMLVVDVSVADIMNGQKRRRVNRAKNGITLTLRDWHW